MKKRFARFSAVTAYVADGEDLAVHTALERPQGPDRVEATKGPLAEAAQGQQPTVFADVTSNPAWATVGLASGSVMVAPVRTEAGSGRSSRSGATSGRPSRRRTRSCSPRRAGARQEDSGRLAAREPARRHPAARHAVPGGRRSRTSRVRGEPRVALRLRPRRLPRPRLERGSGEPRRRGEARARLVRPPPRGRRFLLVGTGLESTRATAALTAGSPTSG